MMYKTERVISLCTLQKYMIMSNIKRVVSPCPTNVCYGSSSVPVGDPSLWRRRDLRGGRDSLFPGLL